MSDENIGSIADDAPAEDSGQPSAEAPAGGSGGVERGASPAAGAEGKGGVASSIADEDSPDDGDGAEGEPAEQPLPDYTLEVDEATFPMPRENLDSYTATARKLRLTREQAEGMLAWHKGQYSDSMKWTKQEQERQLAAWDKEILEDREFGGANYKSTIADARYALRTFDQSGDLRRLLKQTGGDRHPTVVKIVAQVGRQMREHQYVGGNGGGSERPRPPLHERMYGKNAGG